MAKEDIFGRMKGFMMVSGSMENKMVKENSSYLIRR